jgi:hypothetical protein
VILAGATARFNACREGWNGDLERELAEQALVFDGEDGRGDAAFDKISRQAAAIVSRHWGEIAAALAPRRACGAMGLVAYGARSCTL